MSINNKIDSQYQQIGEILIEFYDTMKDLEKDEHCNGKQAVKIIMTISDIKNLINEN